MSTAKEAIFDEQDRLASMKHYCARCANQTNELEGQRLDDADDNWLCEDCAGFQRATDRED
jgi:hypothetical protein